MLAKDFQLPDRPIKISPNTITRSAGTLMSAIVIGAILAFMAIWLIPSLLDDWQIRKNPVVLQNGTVQKGDCTTHKGIFVECEAHLSYDYNGKHFEKDVRQFFVDLHSGDYSVDLEIAGDKPELATISIAIDKYWNRVALLGTFLAGFAIMVLVALQTSLRVAWARRRLTAPGRLSLIEIDAKATGVRVYTRDQYAYNEPGTKRAPYTTLFDKGQGPLILIDDAGVEHGYAVKHEAVAIPVLLDRALQRIELTPEERKPLLDLIATSKTPAPPTRAKTALRKFFSGLVASLRRIVLVLLLLAMGVLGYWFYYVLAGTNAHDQLGMQINNVTPKTVNKWACGKLHLRFVSKNAPFGCTAADHTSWK